ncbi:MAG: hypothetical protein J7604_03505 [Sporocytophaga sp.]|uniref:hypothetical protein n=1 Tax=Sporocytophaga sp. TaxID=2231183 RepID=UPI001B0939E2|nr:hypothetical protein [Sporocytophaga sp.]MBO9699247.1 hypothetical protein [Sporocytophaga sp.]
MIISNVKFMHVQSDGNLVNEMGNQKTMYESVWESLPCRSHSFELLNKIGKINVELKTFRVKEAEALLRKSLKSDHGPNLSDYQLSCFNECQSAALEMLS